MKVLDKTLPLWSADLFDDDLTARIDNNWYSPAAHNASLELAKASRRGEYRILPMVELCEPEGIRPGTGRPEEEGEIGLIEGRNLRPNYVIPLFMKFGEAAMDVMAGDLLIGKDGEPGTVAVVTKVLLDYCEQLTIGGHVYRVRLLDQYRPLAPFISAFLNSRNGQALLRRCIAGGTTPTIRKTDMEQLPILVPVDLECPEDVRKTIIQTQKWIIDSMDHLGPSKGIAERVGMSEIDIRLPTNWAGGGGARSSRITH